jgi:hypothetical protein
MAVRLLRRGLRRLAGADAGGTAGTLCRGARAEDPGFAAFPPAAFPDRLTDFDRTQKWFKLDCGYVLKRDCTSTRKAT